MATMMMDRGMLTGMGMGQTAAGVPASMPSPANMMMVPRCTMKFEHCTGGMKIRCSCDDAMACSMMQNLVSTLSGGMCTCCMMMNGMMVCCCNLTMGMCKYEMTKDGCTMTCTSGDKICAEMIQACCDCMSTMMKAGCMCCVMLNNMPDCCGCA